MITFQRLGRYGRLGNQMFQVASTIGIARYRNYEVGFPEWHNWDAKDRFGSTEDIRIGDWFPNFKSYPHVFDGQYLEYNIPWGFHGFDVPDGVSLVGHMQSEHYFEHCRDEIRNLFKMDGDDTRIPFTAIHVRMGDYGSDYHPICSLEYYSGAMKKIPGPYLLFSDEPQRAAQYFGILLGKSDKLFQGDTKSAFLAMKRCKAHIIANSTFSWWAAWLAGGDAIMPSQWFGKLYSHLDTIDLRPPKWEII